MPYNFKKPARPVSRIFIHCSASDNPAHDNAATIDAWHREKGWAGIGYQFVIRKDGTLEMGRDLEKTPAAQEGNNTGTIAICLSGLDIKLFTEAQFATLRALCRQINAAYAGDVTFHGHCEVSAKSCPVFICGDILAIDTQGRMAFPGIVPKNAHVPVLPPVDGGNLEVLSRKGVILRMGAKGVPVEGLQRQLAALGYFSGALDGDFGPRTRAAVMAFQADNHLVADGVVGPLTRETLVEAPARAVAPERAAASLLTLATSGSRIASASVANGAVGALLGGGGLISVLNGLSGSIAEVNGQADVIQRLFADHGLIGGGVVLAAGLFIAWQSWRAGQARVEDHRSGKTA